MVEGGEVGLMGGRGVVVCLPRCYLIGEGEGQEREQGEGRGEGGREGGEVLYNANPVCSRAVLLPLFR